MLDAFAEGNGELDEETVSDFNLISSTFRRESNINIDSLLSEQNQSMIESFLLATTSSEMCICNLWGT